MSTLETYANVGTNNVSCALYGNYLYTVNYTASKIVRVNLTNSTDISLNWATSTQGITTPYGIAIDSSNGYIYSCNITTTSYISKISLTNPTTTFTSNWLSFPTGYLSTAAIVIGNYIYVSYTNNVNGGGSVNYINKYSLTDPVNDKVIAWATTPNVIDSFLLYNDYLYVGVRYTGIYKISITNPSTENTLYTNLTGAGNSIFGLTRFGNYLYISLEQGATIMRVSLTIPTDYDLLYVKDTTNLNFVCGIAAYGNYLYAVSYFVTNITRKLINDYVPSIYKNLTLNSNRAVVKSGKYLYIANYNANSIIRASLTDSADISLNWATSTQGISNPGSIVLYDNYIYVVNKGTARNSIPKISITNPTTDFNTAWKTISIDSGGNTFFADSATALNGHLYISYGNQNSTVFKISRVSFANPTGDYVADWYIPNVHYYTIFGYNNILYAGAYREGIRKLSPTDPSNNNTLWANSYVLSNSNGLISGMDVQGDYLYVSLFQSATIAKVSLSDPNSVNTIVEYSKDGTNLNGVFGIATRGAWLYAVNYNNTSLVRIPIGTDSTVAYKYLYAPSFMVRNAVGITQDGTYMYITDEGNNRITRLNMTNPIDVSYSWATSTQGVASPYATPIFNGYLYCPNRGANNQVISRISTSNPTGDYTANWKTTTLGATYYPGASYIVSGYLYVSYSNNSTYTISKISITNPSGDYTPNWVNVPGFATSLIEYNGYLYAGMPTIGIYRISLTNPSGDKGVWSNIGVLTTTGLYGLAIQGTNLFVSIQTNNMIYRLDLTNPTGNTYTPEFASANNTSIMHWICGITINGNYIYSVNYLNYTVARTIIDPLFGVVVPVICFKEDSRILTNTGYRKIQHLKRGDLVKTFRHGFVPVFMVGKKDIHHSPTLERSKNHLYKCTPEHYPELADDLVLTGCHSILVDDYVNEEQLDKTIQVNGDAYVTEGKYRLPVCADRRASIYEHAGKYTVYHVALENDDYYMNYGIYANGLLVESTSKRFLDQFQIMEK
jgi:6-phosphogluconolactonase (cycloisomerase 2 family)